MNDENTIDLDPTDTDEIKFEGSWAELDEVDAKVLLPLVEELTGDDDIGVTLTGAELKDSIAYAFMAGVVLAEADMMSQLMAVAGMQDLMTFGMPEVDDGGEGLDTEEISDEIGGGTGGSGLH